MDLRIIIREIEKAEISHLDSFLYEAIFIPEGQEKSNRDIINLPELSRYINNFGQINDFCLVAELQGKLIGAIWTRVFCESEKGFGFVDSKTPELIMSILKDYRQQGIGTKLLKAMIDKLTELDYEQVSLSVDKLNYALKLYKKFGFEILESDEKSAILIKRLIK
jgi:ribosomal protein S18 acetylase RimI-like enzyme